MSSEIYVVTVTYGKRAHLLTRVLDAAKGQGAVEAIVIDNGSTDPVRDILAERYGDWAFVHSMGGNKGTALAFKTGIQTALARGAEFLLLLDDDNILQSGCIDKLCKVFALRSPEFGLQGLMLSAWREGRQGWLQPGTMRWREYRSSFISFRIQNLPAKLMSLLHTNQPDPNLAGVEITAPFAVYGGLFFNRGLIDFIGLPREEFFLYGDDTEFSYRFSRAGGKIILTSDARIKDIAFSWNEENQSWAGPITWVLAKPSSPIFYQFRNAVYFAYHVNERNILTLFINTIIYMSIIIITCIITRRWRSLRVLCVAFRNGVAGRLGASPRFPL